MRRVAIGIIGLILLIAGVVLGIGWPDNDSCQLWMSACIRVGAVLAVLWLAYPQVSRVPRWVLAMVILGVFGALLLARQPRLLLMAIVILVIVGRLRSPLPTIGSPRRPP